MDSPQPERPSIVAAKLLAWSVVALGVSAVALAAILAALALFR